MRARAILNKDGGTLKTTDLEEYSRNLSELFKQAGHQFTVDRVSGANLIDALESAAADDDVEAIIAGGGDGTISAAAAAAWKHGKALGVLPAGTMNLFARTLGISLDLELAAEEMANGKIVEGDIATADGRPFIHQFSVGMQTRVVSEREKNDYNSRFEKMMASARATLSMFLNPPSFRADVSVDDGKIRIAEKLSMIAVANNLYGKGHMPYADRYDGGVLGIYYTKALDGRASMQLTADLLVGAWSENPDFHSESGKEVILKFPRLKRSAQAVIDGELIRLKPEVVVKIHPGELKVISPAHHRQNNP